MSKISVIMSVYNVEKYISEAIESVLKQSFGDFEFIVIDNGSSDETLSIISSYKDNRIKLIQGNRNVISSLNRGMHAVTSKYIACMNAYGRMHVDRLKIQYCRMEESPQITVCSSWVISLGENIPTGILLHSASGVVEYPLLHFLKGNMFFHPTIMLRVDFFREHKLQYEEEYTLAEDYKLWFEAAKCGGRFYIETQPLLYNKIYDSQPETEYRKEQQEMTIRVKKEVLSYLITLNQKKYSSLPDVERILFNVQKEQLLNDKEIFNFFFVLFMNNKNFLVTE